MRTLGALALTLALVGCGGASVPTPPPTPPPAVIQVGNLSIPALNVATELVALGLNAEGGHEVPPLDQPETAGWYMLGVAPGDPGPAVVLGHVNGSGRPGVFAHLAELAPGDLVYVERDGAPVGFVVYDAIRVDKDAFPAQRVYGDTPTPELRLITCGGTLNRASGHYEDNVIVFARAVMT